jgi:hypothetical protein
VQESPAASAQTKETPSASSSHAQAPPTEPKKEFDLESTDDCIEFIVAHWGPNRPDHLEEVASFFVKELRGKASRTKPLSHLMQCDVIKSGILKTKEARRKWYEAWAINRKTRFVKLPDNLPK